MKERLLPAAALAAIGVLAGCSTLPADPISRAPSAPVAPVVTEHSEALACLGRMIERSRAPRLVVHVTDIRDRTVPPRFDQRRLSSGASWWLHTAIGKLETDRVVSTLEGPPRGAGAGHLVISGAWTQDDPEVGRFGGEIAARMSRIGLGFGASRSQDVIAGDFVSSRSGRVVHATAISAAVSADRSGLDLRIDDGNRRFAMGVAGRYNEGPQFAQRRIAEAAALVHVGRAVGIDYSRCLPGEAASGGTGRRAAPIRAAG